MEERDVENNLLVPLTGDAVDSSNKKSTFNSALSSTLKTIVGTGVIALPYGFAKSGFVIGVIGLIFVAYLSTYSMKTLIDASHKVRKMQSGTNEDEDSGTIRRIASVTYGDEDSGTIRRIASVTYGKTYGVAFCDFVLITAQVGSSIAFAEFITKSWSDVLHVDSVWIAGAIAPILIVVCVLKSTESLEYLGMFGNFIFLFSFIMVLVFGFGTTEGHFQKMNAVSTSSGDISTYLGLVIFALAAQSECMSIERFLPNELQNQYGRILDIAISIAAIIYIAIATLCYAFFGNFTHDVIFDNIECGEGHDLKCGALSSETVNVIRGCVKIGMACMITVNYPFTMEGALHTVEEWCLGRSAKLLCKDSAFVEPRAIFLRTVLVLFTLVLAVLVPDFSFLVGLCGTFSSGLLAFVLPPAFILALDGTKLRDERQHGIIFKHVSILIGGLIFSIVASIFILIDKFK